MNIFFRRNILLALTCTIAPLLSMGGSFNWQQLKKDNQYSVPMVVNYVKQKNTFDPYKEPREGKGHGSGFFINEDGDLITNRHVIDGAGELFVMLPDVSKSEKFEVFVRGVKPERDIALLQFTDESRAKFREFLKTVPGCNGNIHYVKLGDSQELSYADEVAAIGYPYAEEIKITTGRISGVSLEHGELALQTTTPTNPGNSGGPFFNGLGEVVGICYSGRLDGKGGNANLINYAIPIHHLKAALPSMYEHPVLSTYSAHDRSQRCLLGAVLQPTTENVQKAYKSDKSGVLVIDVLPETAADLAGLQKGDFIITVDGIELDCDGYFWADWKDTDFKLPADEIIIRKKVGSIVPIEVMRNGEKVTCDFVVPHSNGYTITDHHVTSSDIPHVAMSGIIFQQLKTNHLQLMQHSSDLIGAGYQYLFNPKYKMQNKVVISKIYQLSQADMEKGLEKGAIIRTINGMTIETLEDISEALRKTTGEYIVIETEHNTVAALHKETFVREDEKYRDMHGYPKAPVIDELR